ncbi:MAG: V-type ATP synthase subunit K [Candidatus Peregrinibacteria bacterium]|nr:V-type ATP synthase subunit K [Candidatus Peregrinibacteria bacterium]MCB9808092.1 V-type ATP synthase subunit K [Candidatus Peribacteria bacterium]
MKKSLSLAALAGALAPVAVFAQEPAVAVEAAHWGLMLAFLGAAMGTFFACLGSILGVSLVGQSGAGLLTEKPELAGKVITLAVLPGSQGLYGMVISLLFIFNYGPVISGEVSISVSQGLVLFAAFLPVMVTCLTSAPYQAKVCSAGMHMLAKDDKLAGRVITMAALVETYALLGFLISFFMLNSFRASIIAG